MLSLQGVQLRSLVRKQTSYRLCSATKKVKITVKKKIDDTLYSCYFIHSMSDWNTHENHPWCWLETQRPGAPAMGIVTGETWPWAHICICSQQVHVILTEVTSVLLKVGGVCGLSTLSPIKPCPSSAFLQWDIFVWSHTHPLWSCFFAAKNRCSCPRSGLESQRTLFTCASHLSHLWPWGLDNPLGWGLCHTLQDIEQHLWPLLTRCQ